MNTKLAERCLELAKQNQRDCPCNANERLVEDLEAVMAEQAKPPEPIGYLAFRHGVPAWDEDCVCQDAVYPIDGDDGRVSVAIYTHPPALEPMSEEEIKAVHESITHQQDLAGDEIIAFVRAVEARRIGVKK